MCIQFIFVKQRCWKDLWIKNRALLDLRLDYWIMVAQQVSLNIGDQSNTALSIEDSGTDLLYIWQKDV